MIKTCEEYAKEYGLAFSTDVIPSKSKTKCLKFEVNPRKVADIKLGGNILPWVSNGNHLGIQINSKIDGLSQDILRKIVSFIQRNNKIIQETPKTYSKLRCEINTLFNTSFYGAQIWDLFSKASESLYNTWNVAIRKMFELPFRTHRYFIEAISERRHLKFSLLKREIKFANALRYNKKRTIKLVFSLLEEDTGSIIGKKSA